MHEVALVSAAVEQAIDVARRAGALRIERLTIALRPEGHIAPDVVEALVEMLGRGTLAEGAVVVFEPAPIDGSAPELALTSIDIQTSQLAVQQPDRALG
jgi:Zn finger protein HypA/HybF involved in hydrogenase expression